MSKRKVVSYVSNYLSAKLGEFWTSGRPPFWISKFERLKILEIRIELGPFCQLEQLPNRAASLNRPEAHLGSPLHRACLDASNGTAAPTGLPPSLVSRRRGFPRPRAPTAAILIHYNGHQSESAFLLSLPHLGLSLPNHHSAAPRPVRRPSFPHAVVFHVTHSSRHHDHVRLPPITPNAEAGFVFPSSLRYPVSIPILPLHHALFSRRSVVARARRQGPSCRAPEQPPMRLQPHLPEQCPGIELLATKSSPQEVAKVELTPSAPAVRAPHRRPHTSGRATSFASSP
jgi:hypothetical protein